MGTVSEFGSDALKRRLGELARYRREADLGVRRQAFPAASRIPSTNTVRNFEYGVTVPHAGT